MGFSWMEKLIFPLDFIGNGFLPFDCVKAIIKRTELNFCSHFGSFFDEFIIRISIGLGQSNTQNLFWVNQYAYGRCAFDYLCFLSLSHKHRDGRQKIWRKNIMTQMLPRNDNKATITSDQSEREMIFSCCSASRVMNNVGKVLIDNIQFHLEMWFVMLQLINVFCQCLISESVFFLFVFLYICIVMFNIWLSWIVFRQCAPITCTWLNLGIFSGHYKLVITHHLRVWIKFLKKECCGLVYLLLFKPVNHSSCELGIRDNVPMKLNFFAHFDCEHWN